MGGVFGVDRSGYDAEKSKISKNRSQNLLKSRPGGSKIEPGSLQDAILHDLELQIVKKALS